MQKSLFSTAIIGLFAAILPLNAQKSNNDVGLKVENIQPNTASFMSVKSAKMLTPQLNLPKYYDSTIRFRQSGFLAQGSYPPPYSYKNPRNYYQEPGLQILQTDNAKDLFIGRVINVALMRLFHRD